MDLSGKRIGMGITAAFEALGAALCVMDALCAAGATVTPLFSYHVKELHNDVFDGASLGVSARRICAQAPITRLCDARTQARSFDLLLLMPCTLASMDALSRDLSPSPPLAAANVQLALEKPVLVAPYLRTGGLSCLHTLGALLRRKNIFVAPFCQDGESPHFSSVHAREDLLLRAVELALDKKQLQPVLRERKTFL